MASWCNDISWAKVIKSVTQMINLMHHWNPSILIVPSRYLWWIRLLSIFAAMHASCGLFKCTEYPIPIDSFWLSLSTGSTIQRWLFSQHFELWAEAAPSMSISSLIKLKRNRKSCVCFLICLLFFSCHFAAFCIMTVRAMAWFPADKCACCMW